MGRQALFVARCRYWYRSLFVLLFSCFESKIENAINRYMKVLAMSLKLDLRFRIPASYAYHIFPTPQSRFDVFCDKENSNQKLLWDSFH